MRHVVGGRELPGAVFGEQKRRVLRVIVAIHSRHVEQGSPEDLSCLVRAETEGARGQELTPVGVGPGHVVIQVREGAQGGRVNALIIRSTIEAPREKVRARSLEQET